MKHALSIAGKEFKSSLNSWVAWVFLAVFVAVGWLLFFYNEKFFARDEASLRGLFSWLPWMLCGMASPLTMSLWSDERRSGTWEILATTPIKDTAVVLGKFLAAWWMMLVALALTFALPIVVGQFGSPDRGPVIGGYFGAALMAAAFAAIGLVASSMVQDQLVALLLGWAVGALAMLPGLPFWESLVNRGTAAALRDFGFGTRFESVARGLIDARDVFFYVSATAFFLALNVAIVRGRRFAS